MSDAIIDSVEKLKLIAASPGERTKTYRVTEAVAKANYQAMIERAERTASPLVPMADEEMIELAQYVGVPVSEIRIARPRLTLVHCEGCGRRLTFTDMIHEGVCSGRHDRKFMGEVLLGVRGFFVTVSGTNDDTHLARCFSCGHRQMAFDHNGPCDKNPSSYTGGGTYAHCAW